MQYEVALRFNATQQISIVINKQKVLSCEQAKQWLESQCVQLKAAPLRDTGPMRTADKIIAVALAAGQQRYISDVEFTHSYAGAAAGILACASLKIDVENKQVSCGQ